MGSEKILQDFGIEPEEFDKDGLMKFLSEVEIKQPTKGIFVHGYIQERFSRYKWT